MFINITSLKKSMKESYKYGKLVVGNVNGNLIIINGTFIVQGRNQQETNEYKSAIVEFLGYLPKEGELYTLEKGNIPQVRTDLHVFNLEEKSHNGSAKNTSFSYEELVIFQNKKNKEKYFIDKQLFKILDPAKCESDECPPHDPILLNYSLIWKNETTILLICQCRVSGKVFERLKDIDLLEEDKK